MEELIAEFKFIFKDEFILGFIGDLTEVDWGTRIGATALTINIVSFWALQIKLQCSGSNSFNWDVE